MNIADETKSGDAKDDDVDYIDTCFQQNKGNTNKKQAWK